MSPDRLAAIGIGAALIGFLNVFFFGRRKAARAAPPEVIE